MNPESDESTATAKDAITVSTAGELAAAIVPGAHILLNPGVYNFSDLTEEKIAEGSEYVSLDYSGLEIRGLTGLTIEAPDVLVEDTEIYENDGDLMSDFGWYEGTPNVGITFRNCTFWDNWGWMNTDPESWPMAVFENCDIISISGNWTVGAGDNPYEELIDRYYAMAADPEYYEDAVAEEEYNFVAAARNIQDWGKRIRWTVWVTAFWISQGTVFRS